MFKQALVAVVLLLPAGTARAESLAWVKEPALTQEDRAWWVAFTLNQASDVEVAIVNPADGSVVRHLAAGALGGPTPPPAPLKPGPDQRIAWDGKDDYGQPAPNAGSLRVRVRAGMGVALEKIAGGDPYAYRDETIGGDHFNWQMTGLEAKSDGSVYVMGNAHFYGPPAIRRFDAQGNYLRTVYPPPAGKPLEQMKGWGMNARDDGTYSPQYNDLSSPALSKTFVAWTRGGCADLIPSPDQDTLCLMRNGGKESMRVGTDGTLPAYQPVPAISEPELPKGGLTGPFFAACTPDGKSMFVSGLFSSDNHWKGSPADTSGFWRDGQVWKVDLATRKASPFFALDEKTLIGSLDERSKSPIADTKYSPHAALAGVAVDAEQRVFVCDRQNKRILILDKDGKMLREIPGVLYPDAIAAAPKSKALYVVTRAGLYARKYELTLLKFSDWSKDSAPSATVKLCAADWYAGQKSSVVAVEQDGKTYVWAAHVEMPVRVFLDTGSELAVAKDFYEASAQHVVGVEHMAVDPRTEAVYFAEGNNNLWHVADWKNPQFKRCMQDEKTPLPALSISIDARNRRLYAKGDRKPIVRYKLDGEFFAPDPVGGSNALTPAINNDWRIGLGFGDKGLAVAPDGSLATLGALNTNGGDYSGPLHFFRADSSKAPYEALAIDDFGRSGRVGGVRFDLQGNLYAGKRDGDPKNLPAGCEKDRTLIDGTARIVKYAPTGKPGDLYPTVPKSPAKVYDVHFGSIGNHFARSARFGVDGYGRIYYPSSLLAQVSVIDNEGNALLRFGTYGNRDSMGGLPGDLVPTKDVPLAWPNSVDASEDYIYVSDIVNIRILRLKKTFVLNATSK
ncbi:MAG: hypothetical protein KIS92_19510 [Planctomycetota bacterium]|nr:hypothetical protein [Planctomycetota bacterium]